MNKEEIIVLTHLKEKNNIDSENNKFQNSIIYELHKKNKNIKKELEETKEIIEKEVLQRKEKLKEESNKLYYDIDEKKNNELKKYFETSDNTIPCLKPKIEFKNLINLENGLICDIIENKCIIYDDKNYTKISEINLENKIKSVIGLDNKDLLFETNEIIIYRFKDNNYSFLQELKVSTKGDYLPQKRVTIALCTGFEEIDKEYTFLCVKKLSKNRFILLSNYGLKIYSLNENEIYSLISFCQCDFLLLDFYEINENNFILCANNWHPWSMTEESGYYFEVYNLKYGEKNEEIEKNKFFEVLLPKEIVKSLKCTYSLKSLYCHLNNSDKYYGSSYLRNNIFIFLVDNYFLVLDLSINKVIKKYIFYQYGEKTLYSYRSYLKAKKDNDDEFILEGGKDKTLFKLIHQNNNLELKIIGYYYMNK